MVLSCQSGKIQTGEWNVKGFKLFSKFSGAWKYEYTQVKPLTIDASDQLQELRFSSTYVEGSEYEDDFDFFHIVY